MSFLFVGDWFNTCSLVWTRYIVIRVNEQLFGYWLTMDDRETNGTGKNPQMIITDYHEVI